MKPRFKLVRICANEYVEGFTPHWVKPRNGSLSKNLALAWSILVELGLDYD